MKKYLKYAEQVVNEKIPANIMLKKACQRHLDDLENKNLVDNEGLKITFNTRKADHAIAFFQHLRHSKGEWARKKFVLEPWQEFITASLFGWQKENKTRRFRTAFIFVPRKNGKSTWLSAVGLYLLLADNEKGAEIYAAATNRDQARIAHVEATRMVRTSPTLRDRIGIHKDNLHVVATFSKFEPLGADVDSMDGLNVHGGLVDELHAHKKRDVWDIIDTSTGSRRQPLIIGITTAGWNQTSICYEQYIYSRQVLNGTIKDESFFAYLAEIDEGDEWDDESVWKKANPNFGKTVKLADLRAKALKAKEFPAAQNAFKRKHLNQWVQQSDRWLDLALWDENGGEVDEKDLIGKTCYGGLDLSSVEDLSAWVMAFPGKDEEITFLCRFFCPSAMVYRNKNKYREQYIAWGEQKYVNLTEGDAIDYNAIKAQILDDAVKFNIESINVDRLFQAQPIANDLMTEGINIVGMGQGFSSMAAPVKELQRLLLRKRINHGGNPVLRWMADNVSVKQDPAGNLKLDKASSQGKIDGIVAMVMAIDRLVRHKQNVQTSVYDERGVRSL